VFFGGGQQQPSAQGAGHDAKGDDSKEKRAGQGVEARRQFRVGRGCRAFVEGELGAGLELVPVLQVETTFRRRPRRSLERAPGTAWLIEGEVLQGGKQPKTRLREAITSLLGRAQLLTEELARLRELPLVAHCQQAEDQGVVAFHRGADGLGAQHVLAPFRQPLGGAKAALEVAGGAVCSLHEGGAVRVSIRVAGQAFELREQLASAPAGGPTLRGEIHHFGAQGAHQPHFVSGAQSEQQESRVEVGAANVVHQGEPESHCFQDIEAPQGLWRDLTFAALDDAQPSDLQAQAMPQHRCQCPPRSGRERLADVDERLAESSDSPLEVPGDEPLLCRLPSAVESRGRVGAHRRFDEGLGSLRAAAGVHQRCGHAYAELSKLLLVVLAQSQCGSEELGGLVECQRLGGKRGRRPGMTRRAQGLPGGFGVMNE